MPDLSCDKRLSKALVQLWSLILSNSFLIFLSQDVFNRENLFTVAKLKHSSKKLVDG